MEGFIIIIIIIIIIITVVVVVIVSDFGSLLELSKYDTVRMFIKQNV